MPFDNPIAIPEPTITDPVMRLLVEGRAKIAKGWCQIDPWQDAQGGRQGELIRYCSWGALRAVQAEWRGLAVWQINRRDSLERAAGHYLNSAVCGSFIAYNDESGRTRAQVLRMWDRAIALRQRDLNPPPTWRQWLKAHFA